MEKPKEQLKRIFEAKEKRRRDLASLPIEEKIKILVQLQKIASPILAIRGVKKNPWAIP